MKGKILTCAPLLALCGLLSCGGGGAEVPPTGAGSGDSLTVCGSVGRGFVEAADSVRVQLYSLATPFAREGGGAAQRELFPVGGDGRFVFRAELLCPQLCLVSIGGRGDAPAGTGAVFFLSPGDSLRIEAEWHGEEWTMAYAGAEPVCPVGDFGRAQDFFVRHVNDFASLTDMPAQREECLAGLRALQEEREAMGLSPAADDYLRLQLDVSALSVLALAGGVDSAYFSFLREFDLGHDFCPSTYFYYPAMTNLIRNAAFGLPDIGEMPPEEWMARAKRALGAYIPAERDAAYALLTAVAYCNQLHRSKPFSPRQEEAVRAFFAPGRHGLGNVAALLLAESGALRR